MSGLKMIAVAVALTGCAGVQATQQRNSAAGHWIGEIDRDGWRQPVALEIESENGAYSGQWRALRDSPKQSLENVDVKGNDVRFETGQLRFVGHVEGSTLSGVVTDKTRDAPLGELSATQASGQPAFFPASEWSAPQIP